MYRSLAYYRPTRVTMALVFPIAFCGRAFRVGLRVKALSVWLLEFCRVQGLRVVLVALRC